MFAMADKLFTNLVLVHFFLVLCSGAREKYSSKQVEIKSIKSENGDIFDCIDIMSQPTFQDASFMNHTIQMMPSSYPNFVKENSQEKTAFSHAEIDTVACPSGSIPVWRNPRKNITRQTRAGLFTRNSPGSYLASVARDGRNFGTSASTAVYEPNVAVGNDQDRHSGSAAYISNGTSLDDLDFMEAGWTVSPKYSGDNKVRFFIYWGDSNRHQDCINLLCSGFVQVSSDIPLGAQLKPVSVYGGAQNFITVHIFKDFETGNWWLAFGKDKKLVGYWVKTIFNHMDNGAHKVSWGGEAGVPRSEPSPPMGSGHFPFEGFGKAAAFMDASIVDENNNHFIPNPRDFYRQVDSPGCYDVDQLGSGPNGIGFYFGGPGGCKE